MKTGIENLNPELTLDLMNFLEESILALTTHDKEHITKMLQNGYKVADNINKFDDKTDNLILNEIIPKFVDNFFIIKDKNNG